MRFSHANGSIVGGMSPRTGLTQSRCKYTLCFDALRDQSPPGTCSDGIARYDALLANDLPGPDIAKAVERRRACTSDGIGCMDFRASARRTHGDADCVRHHQALLKAFWLDEPERNIPDRFRLPTW